MRDVPLLIDAGYPPKSFAYTGRWVGRPKHASARRGARRNNPTVWSPLYQAVDGETFVYVTITIKSCPVLESE